MSAFANPAEDDDAGGIRGNRSRSAEVRGQRDPELACAAGVAVAEHVVGADGEHSPDRGEPLPTGERAVVGFAGPEVGEVGGRGTHVGRRRCGEGLYRGHPGAGALLRDQEPFRDELFVGGHHRGPRALQLLGERTRRWQPRARGQATGCDRAPNPFLERRLPASGGIEIHVEVEHRWSTSKGTEWTR